MAKAFLSHSSAQKSFAKFVADAMNSKTIIDCKDFETGMQNKEEIEELIKKSDIFVVFLSEEALTSRWVQLELAEALENLESGTLKRFYPIIIDQNIQHSDSRIPEVIRLNYNLQFILRPEKVVRLITSRLREITWDKHPRIQQRNELFVGRNEELKILEERLDDIDKATPVVLVATGLNKVGRKKFLKKGLLKSSIVFRDSIEFPMISLDMRESIEDFIIKIYDIGCSKEIEFSSFLEMTQEKKINLAVELAIDLYKTREIIFIEDSGSIILPDGSMAKWFWNILENLQSKGIQDQVLFCVSSRFRLKPGEYISYNDVFVLNISTLNKREQTGLFKRLLELNQITLATEEQKELIELFNGFPDQIYYTADLLTKSSTNEVLRNTKKIKDYNKEIFNKVISEAQSDDATNFILTVLVEFDFISFDLLFSIIDNYSEDEIFMVIEKLDNFSLIDYLGSNKEYFKLNEGIKNFLQRSGIKLPEYLKNKLREHILIFIQNDKLVSSDISDFFYSLKGALLADYSFKSKLILPSHYLKTMIYLYERNQDYKEVIILADKVLENQSKLDDAIVREIKYWLCLSLARLRDDRFKEEIQYFKEDSDYYFLFAFYYRLIGKLEYALQNLEDAIRLRPRFPRAQRELVQVLIGLEQYQEAFEHAKYNYENDPNNAYHIQAYFDCLIRLEDPGMYYDQITTLLAELKSLETDKAREMKIVAEADYNLYILQDNTKAMHLINKALQQFHSSVYLLNRKFLIAEKSGDIDEMTSVVNELKLRISKLTLNEQNQYYIMFSKLLAHQGKKGTAIEILNKSLKFYPESNKRRLIEYITNLSFGNQD